MLLPYSQPLVTGKFLKRYKRFFADITLEKNSDPVTVHCANSGSMRSCLVPNAPAYVLDSKNPKRKLQYSLELLEFADGLACINTQRANQLVENFLTELVIHKNIKIQSDAFTSWKHVKREATFSNETRFDFCLTSETSAKKCWIEVKSVSLRLDPNIYAFPDAVTTRGQKHLQTLMTALQQGDAAWLFFVMMRGSNIDPDTLRQNFRAAHEIDPQYAHLLEQCKKSGVRIALLIPSISVHGFGLRNFYEL